MRRILALSALLALVPASAGCATDQPSATGTATPAASAGSARTTAAPVPSPSGEAYRVTYGWAVPSRPSTVVNPVDVPVTPPPGIPLPYLVEIRTGDHADFARITFAFRGAFPEYNFAYVPNVPAEGSGAPVALPGNAFLRIQFVHAQAHDNSGASTLQFAASQAVGTGNLVGYAPAGDFEGYVTYGLGLRVAPHSDQALEIRVGQLRRADGLYVVAFDIRKG